MNHFNPKCTAIKTEIEKISKERNFINLNNRYSQHIGSLERTYIDFVYTAITPGVREILEKHNCQWLIIDIAIYAHEIRKRLPEEYLQFWKLTVLDGEALLQCFADADEEGESYVQFEHKYDLIDCSVLGEDNLPHFSTLDIWWGRYGVPVTSLPDQYRVKFADQEEYVPTLYIPSEH